MRPAPFLHFGLLVAAMFAVGVMGCDLVKPRSNEPDPSYEPGPPAVITPARVFTDEDLAHGTVRPFQDSVVLGITELHWENGPTQPKLVLWVRGAHLFPCCNWALLADAQASGNVITLTVKGVYVPQICFTAVGYAGWSGFVALGTGEYHLWLNRGEMTDRYRIIADSAFVRVRPEEQNFSRLAFTDWFRYPRNSFALYSGGLDTTISVAFVDSVERRWRLERFALPDEREGLAICYPHDRNPVAIRGHAIVPRYYRYGTEAELDDIRAFRNAWLDSVTKLDSRAWIYFESWLNKH